MSTSQFESFLMTAVHAYESSMNELILLWTGHKWHKSTFLECTKMVYIDINLRILICPLEATDVISLKAVTNFLKCYLQHKENMKPKRAQNNFQFFPSTPLCQ